MQCVILAAGLGTRMKELTKDTPKPMIQVSGKPLLEHHLDILPPEVDEVIMVIGYLGEQIQNYFGAEWKGRKISYVTQTELNGTAGAVALAKDKVEGAFLVTMGDDLYHPKDLKRLICHKHAILGYPVEDASRFGIMTTDGNGNLADVVEQPHGFKKGLVNTGAYMLSRDFFRYQGVPKKASDKELGLPQTLMVMAKDVPVVVETACAWQPVGRPEDIPEAEKFLREIPSFQ